MSFASPISPFPNPNPLKRNCNVLSERVNAKQLESYFKKVTKNDSHLWRTTEKIVLLERQLTDLNRMIPNAENCLAIAWRIINDPQESANLNCILERITVALERTERGRLIKILYLIEGEPGKQLRNTLFPCFYHYGKDVLSGPSVKEFYEEAREFCTKLSTLQIEETAQLELPIISDFHSLKERNEYLDFYKASLDTSIAFLERNREFMFPTYFPIWPNDEGTTWLTRSISPKNSLKIGFSPILEGLDTTTIFSGPGEKLAPEGFVELLADDPLDITENLLFHVKLIAPLQGMKDLDDYAKPLLQQSKKIFNQTFATQEHTHFSQSAFVTNPDTLFVFEHSLVRLKYPDLQPKHWPQPANPPAAPKAANSLVGWLNANLSKRV